MGVIKIPKKSVNYFHSNVDEIFNSGNIAEGQWTKRLSEYGIKYCDVACAIPTVSNGSGIMALLQIYKEYENRNKVLIQSNTMYGVKTMVKTAGLKLSGIIDCNPMNLMPDLIHVEKAINANSDQENTIILLSHIGGTINRDISKIAKLCKEKNIILIEDCAHSFGAKFDNRNSGTFGDAGVYSFYATKAVPAGEGGLVITNNKKVGSLLNDYVKYDRFTQKMSIGLNIRPSEVQSLLIYSVVKEVDSIIENKKIIALRYIEICDDLCIPYIPQHESGNIGNYYKFIVLSQKGNIMSDLPYLETTTSKVYDYSLGDDLTITNNHACLPIWYGQEDELIDKVIDELKKSKQ